MTPGAFCGVHSQAQDEFSSVPHPAVVFHFEKTHDFHFAQLGVEAGRNRLYAENDLVSSFQNAKYAFCTHSTVVNLNDVCLVSLRWIQTVVVPNIPFPRLVGLLLVVALPAAVLNAASCKSSRLSSSLKSPCVLRFSEPLLDRAVRLQERP